MIGGGIALRAQSNESWQYDFDKAKKKFKEVLNTADTDEIVDIGQKLERLAIANPGNPEVWYYLGYAIDKYNTIDGSSLIYSNVLLAQKASECFENCIELSNRRYKGERLLFDPHSKILSIWGGQSMRYFYEQKMDSAVWCLQQAKLRGGINETVLKFYSMMLDECSDSAYLFTSGEMQVYYMAYLQMVLGARTDVRCVNLEYLNTDWYAPAMIRAKQFDFIMSSQRLAGIKEQVWMPTTVSVININYPKQGDSILQWLVNPTDEGHLLRSDLILLLWLQQNKMERDVFFPAGLPARKSLFLTTENYLQLRGLTVKVNAYPQSNDLAFLKQQLPAMESIKYSDTAYRNNPDNLQVLNTPRFIYAWTSTYALMEKDTAFAQQCFKIAEKKYPEALLPFFDQSDKNSFLSMKNKVAELYALHSQSVAVDTLNTTNTTQ